jgi:predicted RNA-binding protein with PIN domain
MKTKIKELHQRALEISRKFKDAEAELLNILSEIDSCKAYLELGFSSLFQYSVQALGLSEAQAYAFMAVARKSREIPKLKQAIEARELSVSKAAKIVSVVKADTADAWIEKAVQLPRVELEKAVAEISPKAVDRRPILKVVSKDDFRLHLNISQNLLNKIKRAQALLSQDERKIIDFEGTLEIALDFLLKHKDPVEKAQRNIEKVFSKNIQNSSREQFAMRRPIPQGTLHQIHHRDQGKCQFENSKTSQKCNSTWFTEIHHQKPYSMGGTHEVSNLLTLCSRHHKATHHK